MLQAKCAKKMTWDFSTRLLITLIIPITMLNLKNEKAADLTLNLWKGLFFKNMKSVLIIEK